MTIRNAADFEGVAGNGGGLKEAIGSELHIAQANLIRCSVRVSVQNSAKPDSQRVLRAIQLNLRKKPKRLRRRLRQLGYVGKFDAIKMNSWKKAACPLSHYALPNSCLNGELGLFDLGAVKIGISVSV
ncbi:MAG: hypothetical protein K0A99_11535 [Desulfoarculaceae bacterium]|nr:hypothetical protein [Desulfoarculaceae bacterium]